MFEEHKSTCFLDTQACFVRHDSMHDFYVSIIIFFYEVEFFSSLIPCFFVLARDKGQGSQGQ